MSGDSSCLYTGVVVHRRVRPRKHRLRYRVFSMLLDLDGLPELDRRLTLFTHNRPGVFAFYYRDHGDGSGRALRPWVDRHLAAAGIDLEGGTIRLLCYPRILGYVFNPLSVYFCYRSDGTLAALLYEVNNTFGERHTYLIATSVADGATIRQECEKAFYVSPFIPVAGRYRFRVSPPSDRLSLVIEQGDADGEMLTAAFAGRRRPISDGTLAGCFVRYPLLTLKVIGAIHLEALRLWRKGLPLIVRPAPPPHPVTVVAPPEA